MVPSFQEAMMRVSRSTESEAQSVLYFSVNNGHNHAASAEQKIKASGGDICYTSNVMRKILGPPCARATISRASSLRGISARHRIRNVGIQQ